LAEEYGVPDKLVEVMDHLLTSAERRWGLHRHVIAPQMVFMSHETFTPARGGSASAEVAALRQTFGDSANEVVVANTKGFTGHPMGVGIEDVIAVKILEHGVVPPVPNFKEVDPELGRLNLSRGGRYPVVYALHLAAGFGSQIVMTLTRCLPGALNRLDDPARYMHWLADVSGYDRVETEVVKRVLRVKADGAPNRPPAPSDWQWGTGPTLRALASHSTRMAEPPARMAASQPSTFKVQIPTCVPEPVVVPVADIGPNDKSAAAIVTLAKTEVNQPAISPAPAPTVIPVSANDHIKERVLALVAEKTGYPPDMLDLDLDLEADLGIDTVKQAKTFAIIRTTFDIPRRDDLKLRDYLTLKHVIEFVREARPDLAKKALE
jgi:beta-ketoacyl synthase-like protein